MQQARIASARHTDEVDAVFQCLDDDLIRRIGALGHTVGHGNPSLVIWLMHSISYVFVSVKGKMQNRTK